LLELEEHRFEQRVVDAEIAQLREDLLSFSLLRETLVHHRLPPEALQQRVHNRLFGVLVGDELAPQGGEGLLPALPARRLDSREQRLDLGVVLEDLVDQVRSRFWDRHESSPSNDCSTDYSATDSWVNPGQATYVLCPRRSTPLDRSTSGGRWVVPTPPP